ncbi:MAG: type IV pilus modification PilV family protein [Phycisphaerales bacterium]
MNPRPHHRAFTLLEAITAVIILAVAVPPMLLAVRESGLRRVAPVQTSRARWLLQEKMEDIIADRHSTTRGYPYVVAANYPAETAIAGFAAFSRTVSIAETGANLVSAGTGYKRATVTVSWRDTRGTLRSLSVSTVLTDYSP